MALLLEGEPSERETLPPIDPRFAQERKGFPGPEALRKFLHLSGYVVRFARRIQTRTEV